MISAGVDVVSHTTGTLIFPPSPPVLTSFLWVSLGFRVTSIDPPWCLREDVEGRESDKDTSPALQAAPVFWEVMGFWHPVRLECLLQ